MLRIIFFLLISTGLCKTLLAQNYAGRYFSSDCILGSNQRKINPKEQFDKLILTNDSFRYEHVVNFIDTADNVYHAAKVKIDIGTYSYSKSDVLLKYSDGTSKIAKADYNAMWDNHPLIFILEDKCFEKFENNGALRTGKINNR